MNPNIKIYIGDLKYNPDSHLFLETYSRDKILSRCFDNRILFLDIDYLDLKKDEVSWIVENIKKPGILCSLNPEKIDKGIQAEIIYKENWLEKNEPNIFELMKIIFHEKNRKKVRKILNETNVSLFMINKWIQSNPTEVNLNSLITLDRYLGNVSPEIWISLVSINLIHGPRYIEYKFKRKS